jgi:hypothetical protein
LLCEHSSDHVHRWRREMKVPGARIREGFLPRLPHCLLLAVAFLGETFSVDRPMLKSISLWGRMLHSLIEGYISKSFWW